MRGARRTVDEFRNLLKRKAAPHMGDHDLTFELWQDLQPTLQFTWFERRITLFHKPRGPLGGRLALMAIAALFCPRQIHRPAPNGCKQPGHWMVRCGIQPQQIDQCFL